MPIANGECKALRAEQWADALHQWLGVTDRRMFILNAGKDLDLVGRIFAAGGRASRDFLILSYNLVSKAKEVLTEAAFKFVVSPQPFRRSFITAAEGAGEPGPCCRMSTPWRGPPALDCCCFDTHMRVSPFCSRIAPAQRFA